MNDNDQLNNLIKENDVSSGEDQVYKDVKTVKRRRIWPVVSAVVLIAAICSVPVLARHNDLKKTEYERTVSFKDNVKTSVTEDIYEDKDTNKHKNVSEYSITDNLKNDPEDMYISDIDPKTYDYHVADKFSAENMRADSIAAASDFIYMPGSIDLKRDKVVSYLYDEKSGEFSYLDFKIDDLNYIYDEILLGDKILLKYQDTDDESCIALADASSGEILVSKPDRLHTSDLYINYAGDLVAYQYDMQKKIYKIIMDPDTLEVKSTENISLGKAPGWEYIISHIYLNPDGTEFILFQKYFDETDDAALKLYKTDTNGKIDFKTDIELGDDESLDGNVFFKKKNGNICFGTYEEYGELYITELDSSDGSKYDKYYAESLGRVHVFMSSTDKRTCHYTNNEGLWKYDPENNESECIFSADDDLLHDIISCNYVSCSDGTFSFYELMYSGSTSENGVYKMDYDGNITRVDSNDISEDENSYDTFNDVYRVNKNGELVRRYSKYSFDPENHTENYINRIDTYNSDGSIKSSVDISGIEDDTECFISDFYPLYNDGTMVLCSKFDDNEFRLTGSILVFMNEEGEIQYSAESELCNVIGFASSEKGTFFGFCDARNRFGIASANDEDKKVSLLKCSIPHNAMITDPVGDYGLCYYTENGIYGYFIDENRSETLIEFDKQEIRNAAVRDGKVICDILDRNDYQRYIYIIEKN